MIRSALVLVALVVAAGLAPAQEDAPSGPVPKTIILGFDGMDHALTSGFMADGTMPNFKRLAEAGLFQRLETSNPAQSPVSWAVFNTGTNPGKTGVAGFVSRMFSPDLPNRPPRPLPQPMLGFSSTVPAEDFVRFPLALRDPTSFLLYAVLAGAVAGLVLFKLLFRLKLPFAALLALGLGAAAGWWADGYAGRLPADGELPYTINPMQGTNWWTWLDGAGIRLRGVQVASTYPPDAEGPNTQLLSGLGVPDISGSPGSWFVYTNDRYKFSDKKTNTAGLVVKLYEDEPGRLDAELYGPRNWFEGAARRAEIERLEAELDAGGPSDERRSELDEQLAEARRGERAASAKTPLPFAMRPDTAAQAVDFFVGATPGSDLDAPGPGVQRVRVEQGGWSDFVPVEFTLGGAYTAKGLVSFHVQRCDEEETRVFVPPINIDPLGPPPQMPISAPPDFAAQLQDEIGHPYETLGWACITNPLKDFEDSKLTEQSFLDDIVTTEALREELLMAGLERSDTWDVYFQVFSTPDRVCHMLYRETDPDHPLYDEDLAHTQVTAWGESFPLKDAVRQVYADEDRLLGRVLGMLDAGEFGEDCLLMVVSDHGFTSFRRQVNLNNALHDSGHLVFLDDMSVSDVLASNKREFLDFVDWSRTRAYSLGLGEVFINLVGREPQGIVPPERYDEVVEQVRRDLLALRDPADGAQVVTSVSRRDELYDGPWWKEGRATRKVRGEPVEVEHDGFADLFLGYAPYYRVAWANTMGGLDPAAITDNTNHWSGDHVSVDPSHVPGVLLSNRRFTAERAAHLLDIGPTMLSRYGIDPAPPNTDMDGRTLPFENLTR